MTDEQFEESKEVLINTINEPYKNMRQEMNELWSWIHTKNQIFDFKKVFTQEVEQINKADFVQWCKEKMLKKKKILEIHIYSQINIKVNRDILKKRMENEKITIIECNENSQIKMVGLEN